MQEAKKIYYMEEFRAFMRKMQGLTDEDFPASVPRIKEKIMKATEKDPIEMFERLPVSRVVCRWSPKNNMCLGIKCSYFPKKEARNG